MNYRHIYHAGNFADVMKHLALALVLDHMKKKEPGFCAVDAHGGIGLYDLKSEQAQKTQESVAGILRFKDMRDIPDDFRLYYDLIQGDLAQGHYPGSPVIISRMLRPQDRLVANELHPEDVRELRKNLKEYDGARVSNIDAYECIRANIPPKEKRGIILIDPPFEKTDEFDTLIKQMSEWEKRFPIGVFMLWYPIKTHLRVDAMKEAAWKLGIPRTWCVETLLHPRAQTDTFNGCGLILFNAPFQVPERMAALLPLLSGRMDLHDCPREWLVEPQ